MINAQIEENEICDETILLQKCYWFRVLVPTGFVLDRALDVVVADSPSAQMTNLAPVLVAVSPLPTSSLAPVSSASKGSVQSPDYNVLLWTWDGYTQYGDSGTPWFFWYQCPTIFPQILISMSQPCPTHISDEWPLLTYSYILFYWARTPI